MPLPTQIAMGRPNLWQRESLHPVLILVGPHINRPWHGNSTTPHMPEVMRLLRSLGLSSLESGSVVLDSRCGCSSYFCWCQHQKSKRRTLAQVNLELKGVP